MAKTIPATKKNGGEAAKKTRSCAYPLLALPAAVEAAKALCGGLGEGPHSRQSLACGLGYSSFSGAASSKIGSLVHFGMLARSGGMYSITPLAKEAFSYPQEGSLAAIGKAAVKPVLYGKLAARFLDKSLPEKLDAILSADYGITQKAAAMAAQNFIQTLEFAGLIREGKLVFREFGGQAASAPDIARAPEKMNNAAAPPAIKIRLASGIEVSFPEELAYRLSMGEFAQPIKDLDGKAMGGVADI
jgi:hypothetical protein